MWQTTEFGSSHEGKPSAVLADGSEPKPVYYDVGSSGSVPPLSEWWIYDGTLGAPKAPHLRGSCACGWRGESLYPIDWDEVVDARLDIEVSGPRDDWKRHVEEARGRSVPLPAALEMLLTQVEEQLSDLAMDAPVAALKGVAILERITKLPRHRSPGQDLRNGRRRAARLRTLGRPRGDRDGHGPVR
ncbi:hypothetical protein ACWC5C_20805 [Streptomyces sp. NPDC001700]